MSLTGLERRLAAMTAAVDAPPAVPLTAVDVFERTVGPADGWQRAALASPQPQQLWLCGRQVGKSSTAAALALHQAASVPGSTSIVVSPSLRQSQLAYAKVRAMHAALGPAVPPMAEESALRFVLGNGAAVLALPSDARTIRGYTAHLVVEDEAAFCLDATFEAVVPMLATTRGKLLLLSSPAGKAGHLWELWSGGDPAWARTTVTSYDVPRIDPAWLDGQRRSLPDHRFRAEFLCEFLEPAGAVFRSEDIDAMLDPAVLPLFPGVAA